MNCEDFDSYIDDLAREQVMEAAVRARAVAHYEECETCARQLDDQRSLSFKLGALAKETNSAKLPPMGNQLLNALRSRQTATIQPAAVASRRYGAMVAVAAMVLVVIALTVFRSRSVTPTAQSPQNSSPKSLPPGDVAIVKTPDNPAPHSAPSPKKSSGWDSRRVGRKSSRPNVNPTVVPPQSIAEVASKNVTVKKTVTTITPDSAAEITTDFMPVGYASATTLQDGGQLVRVELPRSALVAFGLPMNVNRYDEKVKADVFFSADGMARAIRFVQ